MNKAILISIDGMRPDGFLNCGNPFAREMMERGSYTLTAKTVIPSVTLPCHTSMFHSVPPERHGISTNIYTPQVRPINGLCEQIAALKGRSAMFYGWEPLRDIARPGSLKYAAYLNAMSEDNTDASLTEMALSCIETRHPDFVFLYLVETDEKGGHPCGWMSEGYLACISKALDCVKKVMDRRYPEYSVIVTADHGGHNRSHGTEMPEDMTIPMFFFGEGFTPGKELSGVSILDIAPTVADVMGVPAADEWEGHSLRESNENET